MNEYTKTGWVGNHPFGIVDMNSKTTLYIKTGISKDYHEDVRGHEDKYLSSAWSLANTYGINVYVSRTCNYDICEVQSDFYSISELLNTTTRIIGVGISAGADVLMRSTGKYLFSEMALINLPLIARSAGYIDVKRTNKNLAAFLTYMKLNSTMYQKMRTHIIYGEDDTSLPILIRDELEKVCNELKDTSLPDIDISIIYGVGHLLSQSDLITILFDLLDEIL